MTYPKSGKIRAKSSYIRLFTYSIQNAPVLLLKLAHNLITRRRDLHKVLEFDEAI